MMTFDTLIVGAGQAGLALSYFLQQEDRSHIVLERGRIGESWLSQRWDSFKLNTPDFMNVLPGLPYTGSEPDRFSARDELVNYFQRYVEQFHLPVRTGTAVISIDRSEDNQPFTIQTRAAHQEETVLSRSIVIAAGLQQTPKFPPMHSRLPDDMTQLHTADYRNATALPLGSIVIVGSGQSGCQIAEDLLAAGRTVYLCTGKVGRVPRCYRGKDLLKWWIEMKIWDIALESLEDKSITRAPQPLISGVGTYGHTMSLQQLAREGVVILGHLRDVEGNTLLLDDDAAAHVRFADEFSKQRKNDIDAYLGKAGLTPPPLEDDPADQPDPQAACVSPLHELNLHAAKVSTVIWATGFTGDFSWIHLPILDADGKPIHERGVSPVPGLYFLGYPWLISRKSGIVYGVGEDAQYIAGEIAKQLT